MNCTTRSTQFLAIVAALICLFGKPVPAHAQFGGGTQIVFDPQMFARQLQQLQQETATVTNQAEQASLQTLELKNQTAIGNLQAVQVSNEIALAQVQQVQMLRQLVMAEMNSQNVAAANQVNYQGQVAEDQKRNFFAAPASSASGAPDAFHNAPPPPQP